MKSFKKFLGIALLPIFVIAIISIMINQSFNDLRDFHINIFVVCFFSIISFCYVYIFEKQKEANQSITLNYLFSLSSVLSFSFIFCYFYSYVLFNNFNFKVAVSQAVLATGLFLIIVFAFEIYKKIAQKEVIIIKEKPIFIFKLLLQVVLVQSVFIFILTSDSQWNNLNVYQMIDIIVKILIFNVQITVVSYVILSVFYIVPLLKRNIAISVVLVSVIASFVNHFLSEFLGRFIYFSFLNLLLICLFSCLMIVVTLLYRTKIQQLSLSFSKKETEYLQLKNQVNPHFLFNNLNTLIAFIETNPKKAIEFGQHLSNIYRHYLKNENDDFVLLSTEIDFIKEYVAIFKAKFESGFHFEFENKATDNQHILSLCLQELIDNIFKHNILDAENPLQIKLIILPTELVIRNTKFSKDLNYSTKFGIDNINKRYEILTQKTITIVDDADFFEVKIPIINLTK